MKKENTWAIGGFGIELPTKDVMPLKQRNQTNKEK